jgi:hypothetical protein
LDFLAFATQVIPLVLMLISLKCRHGGEAS